MGLVKADFFEKYKLSEKTLIESDMEWSELVEIYNDYSNRTGELNKIANFIYDTLSDFKHIHSIKKRIKDPEHLIEKIIRKTKADPSNKINIKNYLEKITDLVGIRILHLYKDDWLKIHKHILDKWTLKGDPVANIRNGDFREDFEQQGCHIKVHHLGYRSVHYSINFNMHKSSINVVEVQVRTLFEEAWSEIDHDIRYPYNMNNVILDGYLNLFNGFSGTADQMGSYIKWLMLELNKYDQEGSEQEKIIDHLKKQIEDSEINSKEKAEINNTIDKIQFDSMEFKNLLNNIPKIDLSKMQHSIEQNSKLFRNLRINNLKSSFGSVQNPDENSNDNA